MDGLSVAASITGILLAAAKVSSPLARVRDIPHTFSTVLIEIRHIKIVFSALQNFLDRAARVIGPRAALIQLEDVVVILTQTVLVFSELETLVAPLAARGRVNTWRPLY
jgi:hypothetical protein